MHCFEYTMYILYGTELLKMYSLIANKNFIEESIVGYYYYSMLK